MVKRNKNSVMEEIEPGIRGDPHGKRKAKKMSRKIRETFLFESYETALENLESNTEFLANVQMLRKQFDLPLSGLKRNPISTFLKALPTNGTITIPIKADRLIEFVSTTIALAEKFGLNGTYAYALGQYVIYTKFPKENSTLTPTPILIHDADILNGENGTKYINSILRTHPVAIFVDPYSGERNVSDYIKKVWTTLIIPIQKNHRHSEVSLGRTRKKRASIRHRDEYIYSIRHLSAVKVMRQVNDRFDEKIMDYTSINRIIKVQETLHQAAGKA